MHLITFEGCDGVGKTSQALILAKKLGETHRVYSAREPFGAPVFDVCRSDIKQLLYSKRSLDLSSEVMLYITSRLEHIRYLRSVESGYDFVVMDRFLDSSEAYQCYGLGYDVDVLRQLSSLVGADMLPDLTFVLDADYGGVVNRQDATTYYYESMGEDFYNKVRRGFLEIASRSSRHIIIDANLPIDAIAEKAAEEVFKRLIDKPA